MDKNEEMSLFKNISSVGKLELPDIQVPSISKERLIPKNEIRFKNGERYDKSSKILYLNNNEIFKGEIKITDNDAHLVKGEYKWPSGQIFKGKFLQNNNKDEGILTYNGCTYDGKFNNEKFDGKGVFKWNESEYIKGEFKEGKIYGEAILQKNDYFIEGNFNNLKPEGKIKLFKMKEDIHNYIIENFNFENENIKESELKVKKDGEEIVLNNRRNEGYKKILNKPINKKEIKMNENEIKKILWKKNT